MNGFGKLVWVVMATLVLAVASSGRAEAGHDRWSISYYGGGGYGPGYGVTVGGGLHPDYVRPGRYGYRAYGVYPHPRNYVPRAPWCPTHRLSHYHGGGYYNGGYYNDGDYYRLRGDRHHGHGYRDRYRDDYRYRDRRDRYDRHDYYDRY